MSPSARSQVGALILYETGVPPAQEANARTCRVRHDDRGPKARQGRSDENRSGAHDSNERCRDERRQPSRNPLRHLDLRDQARSLRIILRPIDGIQRDPEKMAEPTTGGERLKRNTEPVVGHHRPEQWRHSSAEPREP